ncbi:MAG: signal peptidase I [Polyangiaceae bacterium]|nr:signal peptidase I [Polyangiaceae bacterium]MBK8943110.1 signal peptidase I [Polyangiaceae bacterium]
MRTYLKFLAWVTGILVVISIIARIFFVKPWRIPDDEVLGASIEPTLSRGDLVLVLHSGTREAGDLVRCPHPEQASRWVIGRFVGSSSDRVMLDSGFVQINGRKYRTTESCLQDHYEIQGPGGVKETLSCARVDFGGGWHFILLKPGELETSNETTVGAGRIYLVSDNRYFGFDSRDFGTVAQDTCKEKVLFRLWSKEGFFSSNRRFDYIR